MNDAGHPENECLGVGEILALESSAHARMRQFGANNG